MNTDLPGEIQTSFAILGGGPAGLSAAATAAQFGLEGCLIDGSDQLGGQYWSAHSAIRERTLSDRDLQAIRGHMEALENSKWRIVQPAKVERQVSDQTLRIWGPDGWLQVHYQTMLIATGARERIRPFKGWMLPGVFTTGAAVRMALRDRVAPGRRVLVAGSGPLLLGSAAQLIRAGVQLVALIEASPRGQFLSQGILAVIPDPDRIAQARDDFLTLQRAKVPLLLGHAVLEVRGDEGVESVITADLDSQGQFKQGSERTWEVDAVCISHGLEAGTYLGRALGCQLTCDPLQGSFFLGHSVDLATSRPSIYVAGEAAGVGGVQKALIEGEIAGLQAAISCGRVTVDKLADRLERLNKARRKAIRQYQAVQAAFLAPDQIPVSAGPETILCRCEDVSLGALRRAIQEGDGTLRDLKMRTRLGMGMCQGRMCETNACHELASYTHQRLDKIELLRVRPPLEPLPLKMLAGLEG
jgi:thioredoxin reductase